MNTRKIFTHVLIPTFALSFGGPSLAQTNSASTGSEQPLSEQLVGALNSAFGAHPDTRAVHAKGIVLTGTFTANAAAASITKASFLQSSSKSVPVTVRFSDFAGLLDVPDNHPELSSPRGMAIKFQLPDGSTADMVTHSVNGFPAKTGAEFRDLFLAIGSSGPNAAKPSPLDKYLETHPAAKAFLTSPKPAPVSFATLPYFGVNAFKFTNAKGTAVFGRYRIVPVAGEHYLTEEQRIKSGPNYLSEEMKRRVASGPIKFRLLLQIANPTDKIDDPTLVWPDDRKLVELGTISITEMSADSLTAQRDLLFLPDSVPDGIAPADPMISERSGAYGVSYGRRHQ